MMAVIASLKTQRLLLYACLKRSEQSMKGIPMTDNEIQYLGEQYRNTRGLLDGILDKMELAYAGVQNGTNDPGFGAPLSAMLAKEGRDA